MFLWKPAHTVALWLFLTLTLSVSVTGAISSASMKTWSIACGDFPVHDFRSVSDFLGWGGHPHHEGRASTGAARCAPTLYFAKVNK
jgi:hypothetical protein